MVYKLDPLDVSLDFERRPYRRGNTIKAIVTLIPNSDVEIRTASLSLMGQVRRRCVAPRLGWEGPWASTVEPPYREGTRSHRPTMFPCNRLLTKRNQMKPLIAGRFYTRSRCVKAM